MILFIILALILAILVTATIVVVSVCGRYWCHLIWRRNCMLIYNSMDFKTTFKEKERLSQQ